MLSVERRLVSLLPSLATAGVVASFKHFLLETNEQQTRKICGKQ
jgi:hypothetical protein